jgi:hypothetical protein
LIKDEFIASNGEPPLSLIMRLALDSHIDIIPAVHLFPQDSSTGDHLSDAVYRELVKQSTAMKHGEVCLRVFAKDLSTPNLHNRVDDLLSDLRCGPSDTHLVVDYRLLADGAPPLSDMPNLLPHLQDWKSYSVVAGVFPKDLCEIDKNSTRLLPRVDWKWWMGNIVSDNCTIRRPAFGDYTIQHPIYSEPPEYSAPSASIRYAHHEYWVIIRGESLSNPKGSGWHQWPAEAALLVDRKEFQGGQFSFGYIYILKMSRQTNTTGTVQTWLTAGINHHLTLTSRQISSLALD